MTPYTFLSGLECSRCGRPLPADVPQNLCACGGPLLARYDLEALRGAVARDEVAARPPSLWRWHELLPAGSEQAVVSLGESATPLVPLPRAGAELGVELLVKDESAVPTGTFKARGAAVGITRARELGVARVAMPSNGNAAAAWAAYAARAGIELFAAMPRGVPPITVRECEAAGARVEMVDGLIDAAGRLVAELVAGGEWFDASTLKEPYRIEGKKTMGLEIAQQLGWAAPDVVIYPAGGGVGLIGIHKALLELRELGWIGGPPPRMVAVQAAGCAPIVRAWERGAEESEPWRDGATVAFGINVPKALGDFLVLRAIAETGGCAVAVDDEEILRELARVARLEGLTTCPEGAATLAAARRLRADGRIRPGERVVAINTGSALKYPEAIAAAATAGAPPPAGPAQA